MLWSVNELIVVPEAYTGNKLVLGLLNQVQGKGAIILHS